MTHIEEKRRLLDLFPSHQFTYGRRSSSIRFRSNSSDPPPDTGANNTRAKNTTVYDRVLDHWCRFADDVTYCGRSRVDHEEHESPARATIDTEDRARIPGTIISGQLKAMSNRRKSLTLRNDSPTRPATDSISSAGGP